MQICSIDQRLRASLPFRRVNKSGSAQHDPMLQRHHLLPCQILRERSFARMLGALGVLRIGFHDFRRNGLLLPSHEESARRLALPLHRGPHRDYNAMVIERVGQIERGWGRASLRNSASAGEEALMRLALLQSALRRRLLSEQEPYLLNKRDPVGSGFDFTELDALAEDLWRAT